MHKYENKNKNEKYQEIIEKAWKDENFKQELIKNANEALKSVGVDIPEGVKVKAVEETDTLVYLVIPQKPELSEDDEKVGVW